MLIRHLCQLKPVVFLHWCLTHVVLLSVTEALPCLKGRNQMDESMTNLLFCCDNYSDEKFYGMSPWTWLATDWGVGNIPTFDRKNIENYILSFPAFFTINLITFRVLPSISWGSIPLVTLAAP